MESRIKMLSKLIGEYSNLRLIADSDHDRKFYERLIKSLVNQKDRIQRILNNSLLLNTIKNS